MVDLDLGREDFARGPFPQVRHNVLFLAGSFSWHSWLPSFTTSPTFEATALYAVQHIEGVLTAIKANPPSMVLFLSHHLTLHQDLMLARQLDALRTVQVIVQPSRVADLAYDKRAMGMLPQLASGVMAIPELPTEVVMERFRTDPETLVVAKRVSGTEGAGLMVLRRVEELVSGSADLRVGSDMLLQPFVHGREFSVCVAASNGSVITYEPVDKGMTSVSGVHPSKRLRRCPSPNLRDDVADRMREASAAIAQRIGIDGVAEFEFIVSEDAVHFVEMNPRVAATMRMTALACERSMFVDVVELASSHARVREDTPATKFTCEFPLPKHAQALQNKGQVRPGIWVTSRVTIVADDAAELERRYEATRAEIKAHAGAPGH